MKIRVYIDTSVIGGCLDEKFEVASNLLIEKFKKGEMIAVLSDLPLLELQEAPPALQEIVDEIPEDNIEFVELNEESAELTRKYIENGVIGQGKLVDAEHIAIATVNRVDVLVSWNVKHIVNLQKIHGYNSVNLRNGYPLLEIRSPREVVSYED